MLSRRNERERAVGATLTADEFFVALIAALRLKGVGPQPVTPAFDQRFEKAYNSLTDKIESGTVDLVPEFSFRTNKLHGDSSKLRNTMYAASKLHVVSLENPSFTRMTIRLSDSEAAAALAASSISGAAIEAIVQDAFGDLITAGP